MKLFTIITEKVLHVGDKLDVPVVFEVTDVEKQ